MMKHPIKIGDCISLSEPCMGNIPPAPGVCYFAMTSISWMDATDTVLSSLMAVTTDFQPVK